MVELLKLTSSLINDLHDHVLDIVGIGGYTLTDKQLHFIFMAVIGIIIFGCTQVLFKWLAKYSITAISFIYSFTVMIVIVFAIEIQQKITNRGNMEFADIVYGMYGFFYVFAIYLVIKIIVMLITNFIRKSKKKSKIKSNREFYNSK